MQNMIVYLAKNKKKIIIWMLAVEGSRKIQQQHVFLVLFLNSSL